MIYLFIFIYLLFLSIHYDILENKKYKWTHFKIVITLLILVAGLRWRVGTDTVIYAQEFNQFHDLFHLELSDFESFNRMPFWVLFNSICKTIWDNFVLVQLVVAAFSLSTTGYFIRKVSPSLCFFILLCYFLSSQYFVMNMELLRETIAVGFYFLSILSVNDNRLTKAVLYAFIAIMFHVFAIAAFFVFFCFYYLFPKSKYFYLFVCSILLIVVCFDSSFIIFMMYNSINILPINADVLLTILTYSVSDKYGSLDKSVINYISLFIQVVVYLFMLYKSKNIYKKYVFLKWRMFSSLVVACVILLICKFSFTILFRIQLSYNYLYTCIVAVVFSKGVLIDSVLKRQRVFVYLVLLIVPFLFAFKQYYMFDRLCDNYRWYIRYYPYSSVFDKTINLEREKHHTFRGAGYSKENDY